MSRGRRARPFDGLALGRVANRRLDDDVGEQLAHTIRLRGRFGNLRRETSLPALPGDRRRQENREKIRSHIADLENGIPANGWKIRFHSATARFCYFARQSFRKFILPQAAGAAASQFLRLNSSVWFLASLLARENCFF